jgi:hypothetical protein
LSSLAKHHLIEWSTFQHCSMNRRMNLQHSI